MAGLTGRVRARLQQEDELAPLFSGAAWAGTLLWDAAVYLTRHLLAEFQAQLPLARVIELGAGMYALGCGLISGRRGRRSEC